MPKTKEDYSTKLNQWKSKIEQVLASGEANLGTSLFGLIISNDSAKALILSHIQQPNLKLMDLERILQTICPHNSSRIKSKNSDAPRCSFCEAHLQGWWCPESADNSCYYYSEEKDGKRVITLSNGTVVSLPDDHDPENETSDACLFCHLPDERK